MDIGGKTEQSNSISNSVSPAIQFEGDVPSNHQSQKVPMLDMQMRVIRVEVPADPHMNIPAYSYPQVEYSFFKKPMARKSIMRSDSAMPEGIKRETITKELLRRLSNVSQNHPDTRATTVEAVNEYMESMKISGYSEKVRYDTYIAAFKGFERKIQESVEEGKPLHRHRTDGEGERFRRKVTMKARWFKNKKKPKHPQNNNQPNKAHRNTKKPQKQR